MKAVYTLFKKTVSLQNERGSVMVIALLTLVTLTIIGITASTTSRIETMITTSNVLYNQAFYSADGGTEIARELIEQAWSCAGIFPPSSLTSGELVFREETDLNSTKIRLTEPDFVNGIIRCDDFDPSDFSADRNIWFVGPGYELSDDDVTPHTNIVVCERDLANLHNHLLAAGYEGIGKGASGADPKLYEIHSRHEYRARSSSAYVFTEYLQIGENNCQY